VSPASLTAIAIYGRDQLHDPHYHQLCHPMKFLKSLALSKDSNGVDYGWSSFGRRQARNALSNRHSSPSSEENNSKSTTTLIPTRKGKSADESRDERSGDNSKCSYSSESTISESLTGDSSDLHCGSAESYFGSLSDDRDESQEFVEEVESNQFHEMPKGSAGRDASEGSFSYDSHPRPPTCPLATNTAHDTAQPELPSSTRPRPKASTLRDLRKTQSEESKNYVHVFHEQLHTLFEESDCEDESSVNDEYFSDDSFGDDYSIGAVHMKHHINESVVDDERLRERWNYSKELMSKVGNGPMEEK